MPLDWGGLSMLIAKLSVTACTLAVACLFAMTASAGVSVPSETSADSGQIFSGEVDSGQIAADEVKGAQPLDIAPRNTRPSGKSYREWIAAWTKWAVQTQASAHPLLDTTEGCSAGQKDRVWFLGGDFLGSGQPIERDCTIPKGTALFIALLPEFWLSTPEVACIAADPWYKAMPKDEEFALFREQIIDAIEQPRPIRTLDLRLNGKPAGDLRRFFFTSTIFAARIPEDNIFDALGFCPENIPAFLTKPDVAWGFYVFLRPLPAGKYTLRWKADADFIDVSPGRLRQDVTYHLTVK
jgi:hypothetical protein